ncbi:hypothetical protein EX30DRAFT_71522 [Ascodesmis nigricans]|uniref:Uncharacterized protein n=1 Tax=Ascodesmis nigricans TaxID=341454 RepID=A0A4S2MTT9_9PEZI|nr:hypothetical protein EX30DRAFT_71522 [Ascodesmis nigricans]
MHQTLLNDAAIALSRVLTFHRIPHGFFGGFAILATCGSNHYRESKDLDVLVSASKTTILNLLSSKRSFLPIPSIRDDYVAFFWKSNDYDTGKPTSTSVVLVEMFVSCVGNSRTRFPVTKNTVLRGEIMGCSYVPILSEEYLLRGKISAAAGRVKKGGADVMDIMWLIENYKDRDLKAIVQGVDKRVLGLAVKRHPQLKKVLESIGVHTRGALWTVRKQKIEGTCQTPETWGVQSGLGWMPVAHTVRC